MWFYICAKKKRRYRGFNGESLKTKSTLTKRAPDVWDSAAFSSIFLASSFSCSQTLSTPAHTQVTQTVRHSDMQKEKGKSSGDTNQISGDTILISIVISGDTILISIICYLSRSGRPQGTAPTFS